MTLTAGASWIYCAAFGNISYVTEVKDNRERGSEHYEGGLSAEVKCHVRQIRYKIVLCSEMKEAFDKSLMY